ncbi:hypothetical protein [Afifella sp. YEN Y35]|uniref:hypothetical protein n=1 Tax=Afifella sp. YEN Y35 TaxID=3388337 RepID=UPI0039E0D7BF
MAKVTGDIEAIGARLFARGDPKEDRRDAIRLHIVLRGQQTQLVTRSGFAWHEETVRLPLAEGMLGIQNGSFTAGHRGNSGL